MRRSGLPCVQRKIRVRVLLLFFLMGLSGAQKAYATAFDGKGIFSFDLSYLGAGFKNNGWGFGLAYEHGIMDFASVKGGFSHVSLKPDSEHDWITTVGLSLNARIYPFNKGLNMLYVGYGLGTDFLMFLGEDEESFAYISQCPHLGWKQNFLNYVMVDAYLGYRFMITPPGDFALRTGIVKHGFEYGMSVQLNIKKIWQFLTRKK